MSERAIIDPVAEEFLVYLAVEKGRAANTLAAYRRDLVAYSRWLSESGLTIVTATAASVDAYLVHLEALGHARSSRARAGSTLRGLYRFGVDEGLLTCDPTTLVEPMRAATRLPKALGEHEIEALFAATSSATPTAKRDRAILELLYGTGARVSEVVRLDTADLIDGDGLLRVFGKGSKERIVPLGRQAREALDDWLSPSGRIMLVPRQWQRRGDGDALFLNQRGGRLSRQGIFDLVAAYGRAAHLSVPLSPHMLRHSCATHMLAHGADVRVVQELLGHASILTTQLYTKVEPDHLRDAYLAAHPRARRKVASTVSA